MKKRLKKSLVAVAVAFSLVFSGTGTTRVFAEEVDVDESGVSNQSNEVYAPGQEEPMRDHPTTIPGQWIYSETVGKWWYRHTDGTYTTNDWEWIYGHWYHFDSTGWMQTGWLFDNDNWYFLKPSTGAMVTGWYTVQGKQYFFTPGGVMATGWFNVQGYTYYFDSTGEYHETTRRALIFGQDMNCSLDNNGWSDCLYEMTFKGEWFDTVQSFYGSTETQFSRRIQDVMECASESDITYLCITGDGDAYGNITIKKDPNPENDIKISGQDLNNILEHYEGKVVLFLSCNYAGTIINRGESIYPDQAFLQSFTGETRSGELVDDKYIVICSSNKNEPSAFYPFENGPKCYSKANVIWQNAGGWDPLYVGNLQALYADYNGNQIVTLNELYTYSMSHINEQHVVIHSYLGGDDFTLYARN